MKALRQLGFFKVTPSPDGTPGEDTRVLALFRNRAELKKAYGGLQEEIFRLKDVVKQQEAATQRVQEALNALEERLSSDASGYSALVFYQLRRLWQSGRELLKGLVVDLEHQQEERERRVHLAQHNRRQFARRQAAESELHAAQALHLELGEQVGQLEAARAKLTRLWHYFKRRALERRLSAVQTSLMSASAALAQAQLAVDAIAGEPAPEFPGLSLDARRAINLAAIAYAEVLCARVAGSESPLVALARTATSQREATDSYGSPEECVVLMGEIAAAQQLLEERAGLAAEIGQRSERLKGYVRYRGEDDSTPSVESLSPPASATEPAASAALPNVLAEDTWDLFRVLLP